MIRKIKNKIISKTKINSVDVKYVSCSKGIISIGIANRKFIKWINKYGAILVIKQQEELYELGPIKVKNDANYIVLLFDLEQLSNSSIIINEVDWKLSLKIQSSNYKLKVNNKSLRNFLHTQKSFLNNNIFFPKASKYHNLMLVQYHQSDELKYLINDVSQVVKNDDDLVVYGSLDENLYNKIKPFETIYAKLQVREKNIHQDFELHWIDTSNWYFEIPIEELEGLQNTLDFYICITKDAVTTDFRLKLTNSQSRELETLYLPNDIKGTVIYEPYETMLHSLSIHVSTATFKLKNISFSEDEKTMILTGEFNCNKQLLDSPEMVFKERDGFNVMSFDTKLFQQSNKCFFKVYIDQSLRDYPLSTYDLFLHATFQDGSRLVRFKTSDRELGSKTLQEKNNKEGIYHSYFYKTVNNRLSFKISEPRLIRDLSDFEFKQDYLVVKGEAFLDRQDSHDIKEQHLQLILRNRETEVESIWDLENKDFSIKIPNTVISDLISDQKEIVDFFVRVKIGEFIKERKLGFEKFEYVKDDYMNYGLIDEGNHRVVMYATLTPSGNVKVETFKYDESHIELLRQYNDQDIYNSNVWLVGERPDTAQDTGYHFFRYMRDNHPDQEVYYVIKEDSEDVKNVIDFGNVLFMGSDLHAQKSLEAGVFLSSHDIEYLLPFKSRDMVNYQKGLKVFLQHGVLGRKPVEYHKPFYRFPFDMFCVSSTPEKNMVMDQMHYNADEVEVTGLSRFDQLVDQSENSNRLLLIPTWREWLNSSEAFFESEYFNRYVSLLQNTKLLEMLEHHDLYIDFYPHYRMQEFVAEQDLQLHPRVNFIKLGERSVQDLLKSSKMMVTDYSSVSFDFNFMGKPVVFYHFDFRRFFSKGILRPKNETFLGEIQNDEEALVASIESCIRREFTELKEVSNKKYQAFDYVDHQNSKRIYEAVRKRLD